VRVAARRTHPPGQPRKPKRGRGLKRGQGPQHKGLHEFRLISGV
jgi:hypothetical protein